MARPRRPAPRPRPFTPYRPPSPPAGSYDPALDAQRLAAARGLADLTQDVETAGTRATVDYGLGREQTLRQAGYSQQDLDRQRAQGLADLNLGQGRSLQDLDTSFTRGRQDLQTTRNRTQEDYTRNVGLLQRSYRQLGEAQQQQQNQAGVLRGGAALQAAAKRAENEGIERQAVDTDYNRRIGDVDLAYGRAGEDFARQTGRLNEDVQRGTYLTNEAYGTQTGRLSNETQWGLGQLGLGNQRSGEDLRTQLLRARRENVAFGLDIGVQKALQASGTNWTPPTKPKNESIYRGQPVRTIHQGNQLVDYDQTGRVVRRRRA